MNQLEIKDLYVNAGEKEIIKGLNLSIKKGEIHTIMGPNGSGKSTLASTIMGHPSYAITKGSIDFEGENINILPVNKRSLKGIFLSFQHPSAISGISVANFIRAAYFAHNKTPDFKEFVKLLKEKTKLLNLDKGFLQRYINDNFSGGEKKKAEILQLSILNPKLAILDEVDSGLDIDSLKIVANAVIKAKTNDMSILIITHYQRILDYIKPDFIHVMREGKIVKSGDYTLAKELEKEGYKLLDDNEKA